MTDMHDANLIAAQRQWAEDGLITMRALLPLMTPVATHGWDAAELETIRQLLTATARASESAFLLCAYGQLWDAEVLVRSVFEGSLKFAYILQDPATFAARHAEYATDLFAVALIKDHRKAQDLLNLVADPEHQQWLPIKDRILSDEDFADLSATYDRVHRRQLESRWGFTGLVSELSRSGDLFFRDLGGVAHTYSLASHIHHMDMVGASLPMDRDRRSSDRRETIQIAHEGRLISDILAFLFLRLAVGYRFIGANTAPLAQARSTIHVLYEKIGAAHATWMDVEYPTCGEGNKSK